MPTFTTKSGCFVSEMVVQLNHLTYDKTEDKPVNNIDEALAPGLDDAQGKDLEKPRLLTEFTDYF